MPRRQEESVFDALLDYLKAAPTWCGPVLAIAAFLFFRFLFPAVMTASTGAENLKPLWRAVSLYISYFLAVAIIFVWIMAEIWKPTNRRLLDQSDGLDSVRRMTWREFELLVSEMYRREGYSTQVVGNDFGDGGVDVRLIGFNKKILVQCKRWNVYKVRVSVVRELLGVVASEDADRGIIVTCGRFTQDALQFARQNPKIELVDGRQLAQRIKKLQAGTTSAPSSKRLFRSKNSG